MIPTLKLRFVERGTWVSVKAYNSYGDEGTAAKYVKNNILQQWWGIEEDDSIGEWVDVPLEKEA